VIATSGPEMEGVKPLIMNQQQNMPRCSIKLTLVAYTTALHSLGLDRCMTAACNRRHLMHYLIRRNGAVVCKTPSIMNWREIEVCVL
jgi:hypothetical protein